MRLGTKIILAVLGSLCVTVAASLVVQRQTIRQQGIEEMRTTMRAAVLEAESVRESIAGLNRRHAFDTAKLIQEFKQSGDLRGSALYDTVPVVAAWRAIEKVAAKEGYEFRVTKNQARNPRNNPTPEEAEILRVLESGRQEEFFHVDTARNEIVFARPIVLSADCLTCHGDPKYSPSGDGKDIVGMPMENWKAGEVHGAFVLKSKLDRVDKIVAAGMAATLTWMLPLAGIIAGGFFLLNRLLIVRPLRAAVTNIDQASEQTSSAAGHVASASQSLAAGASEQAASIEETSASLEEITAMTQRTSANATRAQELASQTRAAAETGAAGMAEMATAMQQIKASSDNVAKIIKTIDEIAFQTNLLALNAAVEAARAGEAGMGFAVVADEVRALAQRSAIAARETTDKIQDAIRKSEQGAALSQRAAENLGSIAAKAREADELVQQIATASNEQHQAIQQINAAVTQMDQLTQSSAATAEQTASASEQLNGQASSLKRSVDQLLYLTGGSANTEPAAAPATAAPPTAPRPVQPVKHSAPKPQPAAARAAAAFPMPPARDDIALVSAGKGSSQGFQDF